MFKDSDKNQLLKNAKSSQNESKRPDDSIFYWLSKDSDKSMNYQKNPIGLSRDTLHNKYYDTFNFYFSKPINEILANVSLPHVVVYKDYLYFDDETEYLKRFYKKEEVLPKMENITNFYFTLTEGVTKTSFPLHDQFSIIQKRNEQRGKVLLSKLQSFAEVPPIQRDTNQNVNTEGPENKESRVSPFPATNATDRQNQQNSTPQGRKTQEKLELKTQKQEIKSKETLKKEEEKVNEDKKEQNENLLQNQGPVLVSELSFDSSEHDIYSPLAVAEENKVQEPATTNLANNKNNNAKRQEIKVGGGAFVEAPTIQPDRDALRKMQKALFQAELDENEDLKKPEPVKVETGGTFAENFLRSVKGDKNTLRGGVREREREKEVIKENDAENKKEFSLGNSVSFSKKENFNTSRNNDSELKNTKSSEPTKEPKEPFKIPENLFKDPLLSPISPTPEANFFKAEEVQKIDETHHLHHGENFLKSNVISMSQTHAQSANLQLPGNVLLNGGFPNSHRPTEIPQEQVPIVSLKKVITNEQKISPEPPASSETKVSNEEKSTTSDVKPSYEIQAKRTETNISEDSSERGNKATAETTPKTSAEYMKELMKKHYKVSDGSMSQPIAEKFKESIIFARLNNAKQQQQHKIHEAEERYREYPPQSQKNLPNLWIGQRKEAPNFYNNNNKKSGNDQNVFHSIAYARGLYSPPSSGWNHITPQKAFAPSPRSHGRLKSNEGVLLTQESSGGVSQIMTTRRSPENTRSIGDFSSLETGNNRNFEPVKSFDQKKAEYKQHSKSKSIAGQKSLRLSQNFELDQLTGDFLSSSRGASKGYASPYSSNQPNIRLETDSASRLDTLGLMSSRGERDGRGKSPVEKYIAQISKDYFLNQKYNKTEESQGRTEESIFRQGYVSERNMKDNSHNLSPRMMNNKATAKFFPSQGGVFSAEAKSGSRVTPKTSRSGSLSMQQKKQQQQQQQQQQIMKRNGKY